MEKLELKKSLKMYYNPPINSITLVDVPKMQFVMIDGAVEPGMKPGTSPHFAESLQALYGVAYTLKFSVKKRPENPVDYPVMALEGLWWVEDGTFDILKPGNWKYTVMILQPDLVNESLFQEALVTLRKKKGQLPAFDQLRLAHFQEGKCVQAMHLGAYADEPATVARMQEFIKEHGLQDQVGLGGRHHEIYIGDPRRADPSKLKTILRHPVSEKGG